MKFGKKSKELLMPLIFIAILFICLLAINGFNAQDIYVNGTNGSNDN